MTRKPAAAGMFYPKESRELKQIVHSFLKQAEEFSFQGKLKALIVPHAGYIYSGLVAAQAYQLLQKNKHKFKKVLLLGPSHYVSFVGASIADEDFLTPLGEVQCGEVQKFLKSGLVEIFPDAHKAEHSLEVQLPFLQETLKDFELYALVLGAVNEAKLAKHLAQFIDEETLIIASSDLSHYLPYEKAILVDNKTISKILDGDASNLDACGRVPIKVVMALAEQLGWKPKLIDYHNSGDTAGEKDRVVGYAAMGYIK